MSSSRGEVLVLGLALEIFVNISGKKFEAYNIQGVASNERFIAELISSVILVFGSSVQCEVIVVALTVAVPAAAPVCGVSYTVVLDIPAEISPGSRLTTGKDVVISSQFTFEELI